MLLVKKNRLFLGIIKKQCPHLVVNLSGRLNEFHKVTMLLK